jgi:hypothetical protein
MYSFKRWYIDTCVLIKKNNTLENIKGTNTVIKLILEYLYDSIEQRHVLCIANQCCDAAGPFIDMLTEQGSWNGKIKYIQ